ncbi:MAG TPA: carboxymuconolactone decarboxylase family protein [Candidatus Binataceae bacterium]|nr:carboxymuconolactone decarboxylase family protein [Candidatus Binataceae bacterium]
MPRLPYLSRNDLAESDCDIFDRIEKERGQVHNIFRTMAYAPHLLRKYIEWSTELRFKTALDPKLRELAIMTVGRLTEAQYEFTHHWNAARKLGIPAEKLAQLAEYEKSSFYDDRERAVIRYAIEATRDVKVSDQTFNQVRDLLDDDRILMELVMLVAGYNLVVRVLVPLQVELEPDTTLA